MNPASLPGHTSIKMHFTLHQNSSVWLWVKTWDLETVSYLNHEAVGKHSPLPSSCSGSQSMRGLSSRCLILQPSPLSYLKINPLLLGGDREGMFACVFSIKPGKLALPYILIQCSSLHPHWREHCLGFVFCHTTHCDSCSRRGREKGDQYC